MYTKFLLWLQCYDFKMHYIQGKLLTLVDTLSRTALNNNTPEIEDTEIRLCPHQWIQLSYYWLKITTIPTWNKNQWISSNIVSIYIIPDQIPETVCPYSIHRQELTYSNGIIFKGTRMLVPKTLWNAMKHLPHTRHLGIVKTINRMKEIIY